MENVRIELNKVKENIGNVLIGKEKVVINDILIEIAGELEIMPEEERIAEFVKEHPDKMTLYSNKDLYDWHHRLTGSCVAGRDAFAKDHEIDMDHTVVDALFFQKSTQFLDFAGAFQVFWHPVTHKVIADLQHALKSAAPQYFQFIRHFHKYSPFISFI